MKKKEKAFSNTKIAIIFFVFLAVIIMASLVFKIVLVVMAGQFDDSKRFTLSLSDNKNLNVASLSPNGKSIAIFILDKNIKPSKAGQFLEIPIDGYIYSSSLNLNRKLDSLFFEAIFNYSGLKTNLTIIDLFKLAFIVRTVPQRSVSIKNISYNLSMADADKIVGQLTGDELIEKDSQTIQIINGTQIFGLGSRLARLITNMGGDVIIVATSDVPRKKSTISYIDKKTYTVEKLQKVLGYETIRADASAISDITIIIGEDKVNSSPF